MKVLLCTGGLTEQISLDQKDNTQALVDTLGLKWGSL